ncbi:hypothetical protein SDJN02_21501, partial [Cucurbita argyrosperma subsp. argyrosperma]
MDGAEHSLDYRGGTGAMETTSGTDEFQPFDGNLIGNLQSQLRLLQGRVKELEEENSNLSSRLASCCCSERRMNFDDGSSSIEKSKKYGSLKDKTTKKKAVEKTPG